MTRFWCGATFGIDREQQISLTFCAPFHVLASKADVSWEYGRASRLSDVRVAICRNDRLIGGNDLWTADTGLAYRIPALARNIEHYRRVRALEVVAYRPELEDLLYYP